MANGGGGTVVFGVADRVKGRGKAILGIPPDVDTNLLLRAVFDNTAPTITPRFEEMTVPEGTGRLLLMHINQGVPPYTDSSGQGTVHVGKECKPLTGTMRREMMEVSGDSDFTATVVHEPVEPLLNAFCHRDYRQPGPVVVRVQNERLSFENLGGFVGGVRPDNILHHSPAIRNALLVSAAAKVFADTPIFLARKVQIAYTC